MNELKKRMNAGWCLMDTYKSTDTLNVHYFFERGKCRCVIILKPDGYGYIETSSGIKRI